MGKKYWLALTGAALTLSSYAMNRWMSYEPEVKKYVLQDFNWKGDKDLRIVHLSDFHGGSGMWSGEGVGRVILAQKPDLVCVTGDHFDSKYSFQSALDLLENVAKEVPTYFVSGNNDEECYRFSDLCAQMQAKGVRVLHNAVAKHSIHGTTLEIFGVRDKTAYPGDDAWLAAVQENLREVQEEGNSEHYRLVLGHRPEKIVLYDQLRKNLVLCGHAHGAQWQLPLIGGVFAPNQGLFPRYYHGLYKRGKKHPYHMLVNSGLDVHPFVPRINNRPELVLLTITN